MSFVWSSTLHKALLSTGSRKQKQNYVYKDFQWHLEYKNIRLITQYKSYQVFLLYVSSQADW